MALPNNCAVPVTPCCENLYGAVEALVSAAAEAVVDCIGDPCPDFGQFVNHGEPIGPGDYVAGWVSRITPVNTQASTKQLLRPRLIATIVIRLVEDGFPTLTTAGSRIVAPTFEAFNYAAHHSYAHAEVALRALLNATAGQICAGVQFVSVGPLTPEGNNVAWEFTFAAPLRW